MEIELDCGLFKGNASVGLVEELPVPVTDLLLGNDLAGDRVKLDPILSVVPVCERLTCELEREIPEAFPVCAVTRSMASVATPSEHKDPVSSSRTVTESEAAECGDEISNDIDLSDTFMSHEVDEITPPDLPPNCPSGLVAL